MTNDKLNQIYRLFATCVPVRGSARSIIVDLHRHNVFYIPNSLFDLLKKYKNKTWEEISQKLDADSKAILLSYLTFLESNELVFSPEKFELKRFPTLSLQWDFPSLCSNSIIDISNNSKYNIFDAISKFNKINCFHLQIRFFNEITFDELVEVI